MNIGWFLFGVLTGWVLAVAKRARADVSAAAANLGNRLAERKAATTTAVWVVGAAGLALLIRGLH